jgi:hypothetical protein
MQGITAAPVVKEMSGLVERAERACKTTVQLVQDFHFLLKWYQSRPRSRLRAVPILDETVEEERTRDSLPDLLDVAGILSPP